MNIIRYFQIIIITTICILSVSCSDTDYVNSIPKECTALVSIDPAKMSGVNSRVLMKALLHVKNIDNSGLDLSNKIYFYETKDGHFGLCVKVDNEEKVEQLFNTLSNQQLCQPITRRKGCKFTLLHSSWLVAFTENALLIMGPYSMSEVSIQQNRMSRYLTNEESDGIKANAYFSKLDSITSPIALIAQSTAFPEKLFLPFTLGIPNDANPSQVLFVAEVNARGECLDVNGDVFSYNKTLDLSLKKSMQSNRLISNEILPYINPNNEINLLMNVKGQEYLNQLQGNRQFQSLFVGINTIIDFNKIMQSIDGNMIISIPSYRDSVPNISLNAKLLHKNWIKDIAYWKKSCPTGGYIKDWGSNSYCCYTGKISYYFGVTDDMWFYSGSTAELALLSSTKANVNHLNDDLINMIIGQKMAMMINLSSNKTSKSIYYKVLNMLKPILGDLNYIIIRQKG